MWPTLVVRRAFAFVVDLSILVGLATACLLGALIGGLEGWDVAKNIAGTAMAVSYFGLWEGLAGGQTPGKLLVRVRSRLANGKAMTPFHAFAHAMLVLLAPFVAVMAYEFVQSLGLVRLPYLSLPVLLAGVPFVWCASLISGQGRSSLPDALIGTETVGMEATTSQPIRWSYGRLGLTLITCLVLGLPVVWLGDVVMGAASARAPFALVSNQPSGTVRVFTVDRDALSRVIPHGPMYLLREPVLAYVEPMNAELRSMLRFSASPELTAIFKQLPFSKHAVYEIRVTSRGLVSRQFQERLVAAIAASGGLDTPATLIELRLVASAQLSLAEGTLQQTVFAALVAPSADGSWVIMLADPDQNIHLEVHASAGIGSPEE